MMDEMGGLARKTPILAVLFVMGSLASIGLPGFANFWGELTIFIGLWGYEPWIAILAMLGIVISAIYALRALAKVFFGKANEEQVSDPKLVPTDLSWGERIPAFLLIFALLAIGLWPKMIADPLNNAVEALYSTSNIMSDDSESTKPLVHNLLEEEKL